TVSVVRSIDAVHATTWATVRNVGQVHIGDEFAVGCEVSVVGANPLREIARGRVSSWCNHEVRRVGVVAAEEVFHRPKRLTLDVGYGNVAGQHLVVDVDTGQLPRQVCNVSTTTATVDRANAHPHAILGSNARPRAATDVREEAVDVGLGPI